MIEELQKNIDAEMEILKEISSYKKSASTNPAEARLLGSVIQTLENKLKIINSTIPEMVKSVAPTKQISEKAKSEMLPVPLHSLTSGPYITLNKKDKEDFLKEVSINLGLLGQLKKKKKESQKEPEDFKGARGYVKTSNRFFLAKSQEMISKGYFKDLKQDLTKANIDVLFSSYISMMLFSTAIALIFGFLLTLILLFFKISILFPFIIPYDGDLAGRIIKTSWVIIALPLAVFLGFYYYPSSERDSIAKRIEQELPFAVIHMSAISGSGIEPSEIFKIIGRSPEYQALRKEIRKVINQINLYGYDLVTALNNVAKSTPSTKLSELFSGLATTISSGGDLSDFFEKRAETLLIGYRLEREKFTKVAETFMDIYISVVIAAPMILMLLLVMIQVSNINIGFTTTQISLLIILAIAVLNVFFLAFLHIKQPKY